MELVLEQVNIAPTSPLLGLTLAVARATHPFDVTVLACKSADGQWNTRPHSETVLEAGHQVIALGVLPELQKLMDLARR